VSRRVQACHYGCRLFWGDDCVGGLSHDLFFSEVESCGCGECEFSRVYPVVEVERNLDEMPVEELLSAPVSRPNREVYPPRDSRAQRRYEGNLHLADVILYRRAVEGKVPLPI
jgi:hypothetical protein